MPAQYEPSHDLVRGSTEGLLLFLIAEGGPSYGYQMIKEIERRSQGLLKFKEGTVYPALHRIETEGLIAGEWQSLSNGQQRRLYHITEKGRQALDERIRAWETFSAAVNLVYTPARS